jgi:DNA modification methylase
MEITLTAIETITPYARNARKIPQQAVDKVAASIKEFGWRQPVVVDGEGVIVCGHTRWLAAQKLGLRQVPVHTASNLTPAQIKAYRLMDNRSHQETDWDFELLTTELVELHGLDLDLDLTGFDAQEIDSLLFGAEADERADLTPELPENPVTLAGDLWMCGPHHVLCGDATSADDVTRLLGDAKPFLMVTDPPYGVEYDPQWRERAGLGRQRQVGTVRNDHRADWSAAYQLFTGDVAYVWHAGVHAAEVAESLAAAEFQIRSQIVWAKQHFALSRGNYHWQHEPCWYGVRNGRSSRWRGDRTQSTVWQIANLNSFGGNRDEPVTGHGTQKPVELMRRPILNHTECGDRVYDPFLGSGTTLIAAEQTERVCLGLEIDPRYVDVIVRRWQEFSGKAAALAGTDQAFEQVRDVRQVRPK